MNAISEMDEVQVRRMLETERATLLAQATSLAQDELVLVEARASQEERMKSVGDADLMGVERNTVARLSASTAQSLAELDEALARLDAGTFGVCTSCGGDIAVGRLLARPRAGQCVSCAARR